MMLLCTIEQTTPIAHLPRNQGSGNHGGAEWSIGGMGVEVYPCIKGLSVRPSVRIVRSSQNQDTTAKMDPNSLFYVAATIKLVPGKADEVCTCSAVAEPQSQDEVEKGRKC